MAYNIKDEVLVRTTFKVKIAPEFIIWFPNKAMRHISGKTRPVRHYAYA